MSSTSTVCQDLQSHLCQGLSFPYPQKQPEIPPIPNYSQNEKTSQNCYEKTAGNWNFIQSPVNNSHNIKQPIHYSEQIYVHPLVKSSSSSLSTESLEMCTESLGNETGSRSSFYHVSDDTLQKQNLAPAQINQIKTREISKKFKPSSSFPPPLTSISGSDGVQVKTHREGGRLVIKAFSLSSCSSYFQAERQNGRLKLSLLKDRYTELESGDEEGEKVAEEKEGEGEGKCEDEDEFNGCFWEENVKEDGGKIGVWSSTSSRCNGDRSGNKRLPNFHYCVAIS